MITKGTEQYKAASKLANEIKNLSNVDKIYNHSYYEIAFNDLGSFLEKIKKIEGFASKVATTIDSSMNPYNRLVAIISDKQAWILACCAIENNINL